MSFYDTNNALVFLQHALSLFKGIQIFTLYVKVHSPIPVISITPEYKAAEREASEPQGNTKSTSSSGSHCETGKTNIFLFKFLQE